MTILSVVKDVCAAVGVMVPQSVFSGLQANRTMQEMLSLANEMAQRIAYDTRDWTALKAQNIFTGDGQFTAGPDLILGTADDVLVGTTAFNLPANYKRMLLTSNVWRSTSTQQPMIFFPDTDEWLQRRAANETDAWGEWTMLGGQMHIYPIMRGEFTTMVNGVPVITPAVTARFSYLDRNCVVLAGGGFGDTFMADGDSFRLDERLLKLGMIWQWMANKGSPYAEPMGTYSDALANAMGRDQPAPIIAGRKALSAHARVAAPSQTFYLPRTPSVP